MYTFLVRLTNKSAELEFSLIRAGMLLMVGKGGGEKAFETVQFTSLISLLDPGSWWKVLMWLGTSTPWHA